MQEGRLDALEVFLMTTAILQVREDPELRMHSRDTAGTEGKGPGIRHHLIHSTCEEIEWQLLDAACMVGLKDEEVCPCGSGACPGCLRMALELSGSQSTKGGAGFA